MSAHEPRSPDRPAWLSRAEQISLGALSLAALGGWLVVHVLPTYDSLYSLVWGGEIIHGHLPAFSAPDAPTEHPLWVGVSTILALFGHDGARMMTLLSTALFVALVVGVYQLGRDVFGWLAGAVSAVVLMTRLDFDFYAAFAYVDAAYLAALVWAAVLENRRPRRGGAVWVLLIVAGLLRPEGWGFAAAYGLWLGWHATNRERLRLLGLVAVAPVLWALLDLVVTGHPAFSLTYTQSASIQLRRNTGLVHIPGATREALDELLKPPIVIAAALGLLVALYDFRRRLVALRMPLALFALGLASFVAVLLAGLSQVTRYGAVTAVALVLFVGALFSRLGRRPVGRGAQALWVVTIALIAGAAIWSLPRLHPRHAVSELRFRDDVEHDLRRVLASAEFRRGHACGPVIVPSHKLVPLVRFILGAPRGDVFSRTQLHSRGAYQGSVHGVALIELGYRLNFDPAYGPDASTPEEYPLYTQIPPPGYSWVGRSKRFAVYASC